MNGLKSLWALLLVLASQCVMVAWAACPNHCNGHGLCWSGNTCWCDEGWRGGAADCSFQECPKGPAWYDKSSAIDTAHASMECSNQGLCDRKTGSCDCFDSFTGAACQRTMCPNDCNGRGNCLTMQDISLTQGADYDHSIALAGDGIGVQYTNWDNSSLVMCRCDYGFFGPDCSQLMCPKGDDPSTLNQVKKQLKVTVSTASDANLAGTLGLEFQAETAYIPLDEPSGGKCKRGLEDSFKYKEVTCVFEEIAANTEYAFTITFEEWPLYPVENNLHSHDGNPAKTEFFCDQTLTSHSDLTCTFVDVVNTGIQEYNYCSDRGICDFTSGRCKCIAGYGGAACRDRTNADEYRSNGQPGMLVNVHGSSYASSAVRITTAKAKSPDFYMIEAIAETQRVFFVRGDGLIGFNQLTIGSGGLIVERGGMSVAAEGMNLESSSTSAAGIVVHADYSGTGSSTAMLVSTASTDASTNAYLMYGENQPKKTAGGHVARKFSVRNDGFSEIYGGLSSTGGATVLQGGLQVLQGGMSINAGGFPLGTGGTTINADGLSVTGGFTVENEGVLVHEGGTTIYTGGLNTPLGGMTSTAGGMTVANGGVSILTGGLQVTSGMSIMTGGLHVTHSVSIEEGHLYIHEHGLSILTGGLKVSGGVTMHGHSVSMTLGSVDSGVGEGPHVIITARSTNRNIDSHPNSPGGSVKITSGSSEGYTSGDLLLSTANAGASGGESGLIVLSTGKSTGGDSGAIWIGTGRANSIAGAVTLSVGTGGSGSGGEVVMSAGSGTTNDFSTGGRVRIASGVSTGANSGGVSVRTADSDSLSGTISLSTGASTNGASGAIYIGSSDSTTAKGGLVSLMVGDGTGGEVSLSAGSGTTATFTTGGRVRVVSGASDETSSGNVVFQTAGVSSGTGLSGVIVLSTGASTLGDSGAIHIGSGAATGGEGGFITIASGAGSSGTGGELHFEAGSGTTSDFTVGGRVHIVTNKRAEDSGALLFSTPQAADNAGKSGAMSLTTGKATVGASGSIYIGSGAGTTGNGGAVTISVGEGVVGAGGKVTLEAGASTAPDAGGGSVFIRGGASTDGPGGDVVLAPGTSGSSEYGAVFFAANATRADLSDVAAAAYAMHVQISLADGIALREGPAGFTVNSGIISMDANHNHILTGGFIVSGGVTVENDGLAVKTSLADFVGGLTVTGGGMSVVDGGTKVVGGVTVVDVGLTVSLAGMTVLEDGMTVSGAMSVKDTGVVVEVGEMHIEAGGMTVDLGGMTITTGGMTITGGGLAVEDGGMKVTGGLTVVGGTIISTTGVGGMLVSATGMKVNGGGASIGAGGLAVAGGLSVVDTKLDVIGGISVNENDDNGANDGLKIVTGGLVVSAGAFDVTGGLTVSEGGLHITLGGITVPDAGMKVTGGITLETGDFSVDADGVLITTGGLVVTTGLTISDSGLTITTGDFTSVDNGFEVTGGVTVVADGVYLTGGLTVSNTGVTITSGLTIGTGGFNIADFEMTEVDQSAIISAGITVAGGLKVDVVDSSGGGITITAGNFNTGGLLTASQKIVLTGEVTVQDTGLFVVGGGVTASSDVTIGSTLSVKDTGLTVSGNGLKVTAGGVGTGDFQVDGTLTVVDTKLSMSGDMKVTASGVNLVAGDLTVGANMDISNGLEAAGTVTTTVASGNGMEVTAGGVDVSTNGLDVTAGSMSVTSTGFSTAAAVDVVLGKTAAPAITATGASTITSNLEVAGGLTVAGGISGTNKMIVTDEGLSTPLLVATKSGATAVDITSGDMTVVGDSDVTSTLAVTGTLHATGGITLSGNLAVSGSSGTTLKLAAGTFNVGGTFTASKSLTVASGGIKSSGGFSVSSSGGVDSAGATTLRAGLNIKAGGLQHKDAAATATFSGAVAVSSGGLDITADLDIGSSDITMVNGGIVATRAAANGFATTTSTSATILGDTTVGGVMLVSGGISFSGAHTAGDDGTDNLLVYGGMTMASLTVTGAQLQVGDKLTISDGMTINDNKLQVDGNMYVQGGGHSTTTLNVASGITVSGSVDLSADTTSNLGDLTVTGGCSMDSANDGDASFANIMTVSSGLTVSGTLRAGTTTQVSDERLKEQVQQVVGPFNSLRKLRGVYYKWASDVGQLMPKSPGLAENKRRQVGLIAQDVMAAFPAAAVENNAGSDFLGVDYNGLSGLVIEGLRELHTRAGECHEAFEYEAHREHLQTLNGTYTALYEADAAAQVRVLEHEQAAAALLEKISSLKADNANLEGALVDAQSGRR